MNVKVLFIECGLHGSEGIQDRPEIRLRSLHVAEIDDQAHHFVGYDVDFEESRVSAAVTRFDRSAPKGITDSGRIYELIGNPGGNLDADCVWKS